MKGRWLLLGLALVAVLGLAVLTAPVNAQSSGLQDVTVSVPAGQTVQIPVELWCLNFGKPFPKAVTGPAGPALAKALAVLDAAYSGGQAMSDPYQTQLALWYAVDGTFHDQAGQGHTVAQQIVSKAGISAGNAANATSTAVSTASTNSNFKVTVENLTAVPDTNNSATPYHGTATLVIQNTGNSAANFTFTQGSTFTPATSAEQTLIGVSTGTSAQATATTTTVAATAPTVAATATTAATTAPTVAATATTAATTAPTVAATSTPVTVETLTPVAQATSTASPSSLPTTGGSDGSMGLVLILGGLMILIGGGLALRQNMIRR